MNEMMIFSNPEFGNVRTVTIDGNPWFVGNDVAKALGYVKERNAIANHVDKEDALKCSLPSNSGVQETIVINESGLFSLILSSKLDSAKRFKHWVTAEVLPSIRKTGKYEAGQKQDSYQIADPIERAKRWIEEQQEKQLLEQKVQEQKPKAEYFDSLVDNRCSQHFGTLRKNFTCHPRHLQNGCQITVISTETGTISSSRMNSIESQDFSR